MTPTNYTSQPLSKALADAGFEGESATYWTEKAYRNEEKGEWTEWVLVVNGVKGSKFFIALEHQKVPAYDIANDLLIRYAKEVWGEGKWFVYEESTNKMVKTDEMDYLATQQVLSLLQQGKKQEAEDYIMEHSVLFKKK